MKERANKKLLIIAFSIMAGGSAIAADENWGAGTYQDAQVQQNNEAGPDIADVLNYLEEKKQNVDRIDAQGPENLALGEKITEFNTLFNEFQEAIKTGVWGEKQVKDINEIERLSEEIGTYDTQKEQNQNVGEQQKPQMNEQNAQGEQKVNKDDLEDEFTQLSDALAKLSFEHSFLKNLKDKIQQDRLYSVIKELIEGPIKERENKKEKMYFQRNGLEDDMDFDNIKKEKDYAIKLQEDLGKNKADNFAKYIANINNENSEYDIEDIRRGLGEELKKIIDDIRYKIWDKINNDAQEKELADKKAAEEAAAKQKEAEQKAIDEEAEKQKAIDEDVGVKQEAVQQEILAPQAKAQEEELNDLKNADFAKNNLLEVNNQEVQQNASKDAKKLSDELGDTNENANRVNLQEKIDNENILSQQAPSLQQYQNDILIDNNNNNNNNNNNQTVWGDGIKDLKDEKENLSGLGLDQKDDGDVSQYLVNQEQEVPVNNALLKAVEKEQQQQQPIVEQPKPIVEQPKPIVEQPKPIVEQPKPIVEQKQQEEGQEKNRIGGPSIVQREKKNVLMKKPQISQRKKKPIPQEQNQQQKPQQEPDLLQRLEKKGAFNNFKEFNENDILKLGNQRENLSQNKQQKQQEQKIEKPRNCFGGLCGLEKLFSKWFG